MPPKVIVLSGYGVNSEEETKFVFERAGAQAEIVHINDLIDGYRKLAGYQIMVFPGGFAYGDDTGAGNAYALKMKNNLWDEVDQFVTEDKLVVGICNGCQIIANLGLVPGFEGKYGERKIALRNNASARYECRWVNIKNQTQKCVWTQGIELLRLPVSHGEGNFYLEGKVLTKLKENDQVVFRYVNENGLIANGEFPYNPNGSLEDIAGVCDQTGRILALMPHPERNWSFYNQDNWTWLKEKARREGREIKEESPINQLFKNAVNYFK